MNLFSFFTKLIWLGVSLYFRSHKKEHVFTAENHESMMIWLLGLQAKRDLHSKMIANQKKADSKKSPVIH